MSDIRLIESSRALAASKDPGNNSVWTSKVSTGTLKSGSLVSLNSGFIHLPGGSSSIINIPEDLEHTVTWGYYGVNDSTPGRNASAGFEINQLERMLGVIPGDVIVLDTYDMTYSIPKGFYSPDEICAILTRQGETPTSLGTEKREGETDVGQVINGPVLRAVDLPRANYVLERKLAPEMISSTKREMVGSTGGVVWGLDKEGYISIQQMHTPRVDDHMNPTCAYVKKTGSDKFIWTTSRGGIFFTDMGVDPLANNGKDWEESLWGILGFDYSDLVGKKDPTTIDDCLTTTGSVTTAFSLLSSGTLEVSTAETLDSQIISENRPLRASRYARKLIHPYFWLETSIRGSGSTSLGDGRRGTVTALVSQNYSEGDYVFQFQSPISWILSQDQDIGYLDVRILDPVNRQPVQYLGEYSSVVLTVEPPVEG